MARIGTRLSVTFAHYRISKPALELEQIVPAELPASEELLTMSQSVASLDNPRLRNAIRQCASFGGCESLLVQVETVGVQRLPYSHESTSLSFHLLKVEVPRRISRTVL